MADAHRTNVLVTSCLKTPVDPHTKAPLASYERERVLPCKAGGHVDNRDYEKELEYEDSGSSSDCCDDDCVEKEYYSKLEELKTAHLRTMAELDRMYRRKLQLQALEPSDITAGDVGHSFRPLWSRSRSARLRKSHSAVELRTNFGDSDSSEENDVEKGLLSSPKEHIKNMWRGFKLPPRGRRLSSSSLRSLPVDPETRAGANGKRHHAGDKGQRKHRVTVPKPFHMTLREAERRKHDVKTRSEMELENAELRRQLEDLTECQRKFRASPVPAHVHLPLYEELQEQKEERRRSKREEQRLRLVQKPFSFLERERVKKEQKQLRRLQAPDRDKVKPFKAKPVPKSVYAAASGEQMKEEQLYRSIKMKMRAEELLHSSSVPPSMLERRLGERHKNKDGHDQGDGRRPHRPQINREVPDFKASYRRFQKHLETRREVKPTTTCEPFDLKTSQISSHHERILADIEKDRQSPRMLRWPYISPGPVRTPNSSLCSSLSGSLEVLPPSKATDATKKRHEAVRKALEQRRRAEEEEERWRDRQKQRERKLQRVVLKRAQANDPHLALTQTHQTKLKEFRKQDFQRRKEYQQEIKDMQQRVKRRPLLLEQVAQKNAKQAAEKRYTDALLGCELTEEFVSSKAGCSKLSGQLEADAGGEPVLYRKVYLDDEEASDEEEASQNHTDASEESYRYSDDHDSYSDDADVISSNG